MELSKQVCSLELAKRLKELGVKQLSLFAWYHRKERPEWTEPNHPENAKERWVLCQNDLKPMWSGRNCNEEQAAREVSTFTCSELGEMMQWEKLYLVGFPEALLWFCDGTNSEVDCRAKMLIHLIENGHIKMEKSE